MSKDKPGRYIQNEWIKEMTDRLCMLEPDIPRNEIEDYVISQYLANFKDHQAMIYNSYENTVTNTTLAEVLDWIQIEEPIMSESGVFFYPKHKKRNVNIEIIKEEMLDKRDIHKGEMFKALDAGDVFTAAVKEIQQVNDKKAANSGYGAEGQSSSFLFNAHAAMSVTAAGRGQLSTAIGCFENLFGDAVKFFNMDEFHMFIRNVIHESKSWKFGTFNVIDEVPEKEQWVNRFLGKFLHPSLYDIEQVEAIYDGLDDELRARTYYKTNLREFLLRNEKPADIYIEIADIDCEFIDPNKIPKEIADQVKELTDMVTEFVNYKYSNFRYQDRARYQRRQVVILSDTDSTFLAYQNILNFVMTKVLPMKLFKHHEDPQLYKIKILNVLSTFASGAIRQTLDNYLGYVHVAPEDMKYVTMKNEFYYKRIVVTYAKKSYIGLLTRKESSILKKPKMDVKGVNFFKSTASEKTSQFIYDEILMGQIFQPKDGKISLRRTYKAIADFQERIAGEIKEGEMGFLKRSIRVKSADAYANPFRISQYKAVYVWNYVMPDKERIDLPATTTLVKVKLQTKKDIAALAPWPDIYERMMHLFDTNPEFGDHIEKNAKGQDKLVKGKGVNAIALPVDYDEVPDWVLAVIDVDTLVNNNMLLFTQLYAPLGLTSGKASYNKQQLKYYTNIVRI